MKWLMIVVMALMVGCAATPKDLHSDIRGRIIGKPIEAAVKFYGEPTWSRKSGENTFYGWGRTAATVYQNTTKSEVSGKVDGAAYTATAYTSQPSVEEYACVLALEVDRQGTVLDYRVKGQMGACKSFMDGS